MSMCLFAGMSAYTISARYVFVLAILYVSLLEVF